jgi:hypothetical protein
MGHDSAKGVGMAGSSPAMTNFAVLRVQPYFLLPSVLAGALPLYCAL